MNRKSFRSAVRLLPPRRASVALATALTLLAAGEAAAQWQGIAAQNAAFDARFNQWMAGNQQRLAQSQQQLWQRRRRRQGYVAWRASADHVVSGFQHGPRGRSRCCIKLLLRSEEGRLRRASGRLQSALVAPKLW